MTLGCPRPDARTVRVVVGPHKRVQAILGEQLAAYGRESLLGHVDITESWERHGFLPSMALFRPLQNARDNLVHNQP